VNYEINKKGARFFETQCIFKMFLAFLPGLHCPMAKLSYFRSTVHKRFPWQCFVRVTISTTAENLDSNCF